MKGRMISRSHARMAATAAAVLATGLPAVAWADNDLYWSEATFCNGASYLCTRDDKRDQPTPVTSAITNFAGAQTYSVKGGMALASAIFAPGAPTLLPDGVYGASGLAAITYTFQVHGAAGVYVPVHIGANITAGAVHATDDQGQNYKLVPNPDPNSVFDNLAEPSNYDINAAAHISVKQNGNGLEEWVQSQMFGLRNQAFNAQGKGLNIDQTFFFLSNTDIDVVLDAHASVNYTTLYPIDGTTQYGDVSAFADPFFTIGDPDFNDFTIVGVPNGSGPVVTPPASVPEPTSWALMILGLGAVGSAMRFRPRKTSAGLRI